MALWQGSSLYSFLVCVFVSLCLTHSVAFNSVDEERVRQQLAHAVVRVKQVLDATRNPQYAGDVPHSYNDKYVLAQAATQTAVSAELNVLNAVWGVNGTELGKLVGWAHNWNETVTLRFKAEVSSVFVKKVEREVESAVKTVVERTGLLETVIGVSSNTVHKVVTKVTDYYWKFAVDWKLEAYAGSIQSENGRRTTLLARRGEVTKVSSTAAAPHVPGGATFDVDLTWLLRNLENNSPYGSNFMIDRSAASCHTPRRNQEVSAALKSFEELYNWSDLVSRYFRSQVFTLQQYKEVQEVPTAGLKLELLNAEECFDPILPIMEKKSDQNISRPLSQIDVNMLLAEQHRSLSLKLADLAEKFPSAEQGELISMSEARLMVATDHTKRLAKQYSDLVDSIEWLLRRQLNAAIGKEITAEDFDEYMRFHSQKLFVAPYQPSDFSFAVRRPAHDPEGLLSIERVVSSDDSSVSAIQTLVRRFDAPGDSPMHFEVSAGVRVSFVGPKYLHATLLHQFSGAPLPSLQIVARTRQFSSFLMLVGQIGSAGKFEPSHAMMLQNKDELRVALSVLSFPNAKQFADAIESLSPEQQAFARAFREMQLGTTLFGLCVVQIKPQLELLLNLPSNSLTKEIELSQDLLELFVEYQVPSDLLSFEGPEPASTQDKLQQVKANVERMQAMLAKMKNKELLDEKMKQDKREATRGNEEDIERHYPRSYQYYGGDSMGAVLLSDDMMVQSPESSSSSSPRADFDSQSPSQHESSTTTSEKKDSRKAESSTAMPVSTFKGLDVTTIPHRLDQVLFQFDEEAAVRPATIKLGSTWNKRSVGLLGEGRGQHSEGISLSTEQQKQETSRAFDLLDALSKGGALPLQEATLHVLTASVHTFDQTLLNTVIQDNINPIERVEKSMLILASTINDLPASSLVEPREISRLQVRNPLLFLNSSTF